MMKSVQMLVLMAAAMLAVTTDAEAGPFRNRRAKHDCCPTTCQTSCAPTNCCATQTPQCCPTQQYAARTNCCPQQVVRASCCGTVGNVVVAMVPAQPPMPLPAGPVAGGVAVGPIPAAPMLAGGSGCCGGNQSYGGDNCCDPCADQGRNRRFRIFRR